MKRTWMDGGRLWAVGFSLALVMGGATACEKAKGGSEGASTTTVAAAAQPAKINFGVDTAFTGAPQFRTAKAKGLFQKYGVEGATTDFSSGVDLLNAMLVDRVDAGSAADFAALNALGKGDLVIVATILSENDARAKFTVLFVRGDITSDKDLVGKRLGTTRGTITDYRWARYLEKVGIRDNQVQFVNLPTPTEAIVAMEKGQVDAVWATNATVAKMKEIAGVKPLIDSSVTGVRVRSFLVMQRAVVEKIPDGVGNALKALSEATEYVKGHHEETAELLFTAIKMPKEDALRDLGATEYTIRFLQEDFDHLDRLHAWLTQRDLLKEKYDLKSKIAIEPLKKALPDRVTYKPQ